jgi:SNF2 family DNA or RNA helicase
LCFYFPGETEEQRGEKSKNSDEAQLTDEQLKNLIIPPKAPAKANGRRKATLIVTPASLISHWLGQIEQHIDKRVDLSIFVHHGTSKAMLGSDLQVGCRLFDYLF